MTPIEAPRPPGSRNDLGERAEHEENGERGGDRRQRGPTMGESDERDQHHNSAGEGDREPLRNAQQIAALPGEREAERRDEGDRHQQRPGSEVEERRADRDLLAGQLLERERIERAEEDDRADGGQQQVVEHQRALARDRRETARPV